MEHHSFFAEPRAWVGVAFVLFFLIFGRTLWRVVARMLDGHAGNIRAELAEAGRLRTEAQAMLEEAQRARAAALSEARLVLERSHAEAARLTREAHDQAVHAAARREKMALDRIAAAEQAVVTDLKREATDIAIRAAERVIAQTLQGDDAKALIDEAIAGLPKALRAA